MADFDDLHEDGFAIGASDNLRWRAWHETISGDRLTYVTVTESDKGQNSSYLQAFGADGKPATPIQTWGNGRWFTLGSEGQLHAASLIAPARDAYKEHLATSAADLKQRQDMVASNKAFIRGRLTSLGMEPEKIEGFLADLITYGRTPQKNDGPVLGKRGAITEVNSALATPLLDAAPARFRDALDLNGLHMNNDKPATLRDALAPDTEFIKARLQVALDAEIARPTESSASLGMASKLGVPVEKPTPFASLEPSIAAHKSMPPLQEAAMDSGSKLHPQIGSLKNVAFTAAEMQELKSGSGIERQYVLEEHGFDTGPENHSGHALDGVMGPRSMAALRAATNEGSAAHHRERVAQHQPKHNHYHET